MGERASAGDLLVVDDTPGNLKLLEAILTAEGHRVRPFPRGRMALAVARIDPPDIILLDVNMPEMDGYDVCNALKADPRIVDIPVLFIDLEQTGRIEPETFPAVTASEGVWVHSAVAAR